MAVADLGGCKSADIHIIRELQPAGPGVWLLEERRLGQAISFNEWSFATVVEGIASKEKFNVVFFEPRGQHSTPHDAMTCVSSLFSSSIS